MASHILLASLLVLVALTGAPAEVLDCKAVLCGLQYNPVCAADGYSYINECVARCSNPVNNVGPIKQGRCPLDPACSCTNDPKYVCDGQGVTWTNACNADCMRAPRPFRPGRCPPSSPPKCTPSTPCKCTRNFKPVCGSDRKTYDNACIAKCNCITKYTEGPCPCQTSPTTFSPVCGKDGQTYHNRELAVCSGVAVASTGDCPLCPAVRGCPRTLIPVCGADGRTYCNACVAKASKVSIAKTGRCSPTCLPVGGVCHSANSKCCGSGRCFTGPVAKPGKKVGRCRTGPLPIG